MKQYLGDGYIYIPPRCPACKTDTPNEIEDAGHTGLNALLQCRSCGHLWERGKIRITKAVIEYGWRKETIMAPGEQRRLPPKKDP